MTYVVGYAPHKHDRSAIELACQLARSRPEPVVAVSVVPRGWGTPLAAGTDREYEQWAAGEGADSAALAAADLAQHPAVDGSAVWTAGRSVPQTLLEEAAAKDAGMLVVGSADDAEPGRIRLTSKTDRLVHSSTVPVAIAPWGYRTSGGVTRITVAFRDDDASWSLLRRVAEISQRRALRSRRSTRRIRVARAARLVSVRRGRRFRHRSCRAAAVALRHRRILQRSNRRDRRAVPADPRRHPRRSLR